MDNMHIDYFVTVLNTVENLIKKDKVSKKIIDEYKEFRRQLEVCLKNDELIEKDEIPNLKKRFYNIDLKLLERR